MSTQLIMAFILGGASLISAIIAFVNLLRPKGEWQKFVEEERAAFNTHTSSSPCCKDCINVRAKFTISLLCRRLQQTGDALIPAMLIFSIVIVLAAILGILLWLSSQAVPIAIANIAPASSTIPTHNPVPDGFPLILTGIYGAFLLISLTAVFFSYLLNTSIQILESGRENP